jgi:hypothetical protein
MLVVYGGTLLKDGTTTSDVFWITLDRMEWHLQPCKGERPPPRCGIEIVEVGGLRVGNAGLWGRGLLPHSPHCAVERVA